MNASSSSLLARGLLGLSCALALLWARLAAGDDGPTAAASQIQIAGETWHLGEVREAPGHVPAQLEGFEELDCASCHARIAEEWSRSLHALAWVDPIYQESLVGLRRPESCHSCHAPRPLHVTGVGLRPKVRDESRALGVHCASCHLGPEGEILGPWGAPTDAHRSVRSASFLPEGESELCLSCHSTTVGPVIGLGRDFQSTEQHALGKSCVACHMAPLERPAAIDPVTGEASAVRPGRSHHLQSARDPAFLAQAFSLRAEARDGRTVVVLTNRCGHRVPGLEDRRLELVAEALGAAGEVLATTEAEIAKSSFLPIDGTLEMILPVVARRVRLHGVHHSPALLAPVEFLDVSLDVE